MFSPTRYNASVLNTPLPRCSLLAVAFHATLSVAKLKSSMAVISAGQNAFGVLLLVLSPCDLPDWLALQNLPAAAMKPMAQLTALLTKTDVISCCILVFRTNLFPMSSSTNTERTKLALYISLSRKSKVYIQVRVYSRVGNHLQSLLIGL